MMQKDIRKQELIGTDVKICHPCQGEMAGKIIDETRNTITIRSGKKKTRLIKNDITITAEICGKTYRIQGKVLVGRPQDRII